MTLTYNQVFGSIIDHAFTGGRGQHCFFRPIKMMRLE
jgi:hypothetical protein